ncbi:MAG: dienelactone hydrolase family protein [Reyranella sp.]|nr:dienelactone hydrolase family protein [Reyranella sp.]
MRRLRLLLLALLLGHLALPAFAKPEDFRNFVIWSLPPGDQRVPVVILIEGNGGTGANARSPWVEWFTSRGVAVAQVRSAAQRGRQNWSGTGCGLQYRGDARDVLDLARLDQPRIDTTRFAVMGFSRGGTEVLNSARSFQGAAAGPTAVFAFYPGCEGWCQTDYAKDGPTAVHILYGDKDDWGQYRDSYGQCRRLAGGRIVFHTLPGAHHGFDGRSSGSFNAAGQVFRYEPNAQAVEQARAIVWQALAPAWNLR